MSQEKTRTEKQDIPFYNDADAAWAQSCALLSEAVKDRKSHFRTGNIAYISENMPHIRTVVLRHVSGDLKEIGFHTDYRSPKIKALLENPHCTMHFYAPAEKLQLIASGSITLHHKDKIAEEAWEKTQVLSRRCYLSEDAPSTLSDTPTSGFPEDYVTNNQTTEESEKGYDNFCVARLNVTSWERLFLHRNGNRRIAFDWDQNQEKFIPQWLVP